MEPVAAHVEAIAFVFQVVHQFFGTLHQTRLGGTEVQKPVTGFETVGLRCVQSLAEAEWTAEALDDQVVARNFTLGVARPQVDIGFPVFIVEEARLREIPAQLEDVEQLL